MANRPKVLRLVSDAELAELVTRMKALRLTAEIDTLELDRLARLSRGYVAKLERDGRGDPKLSNLTSLSRVLGCKVGYLAAGEGARPSIQQIRAAVTKAQREAAQAAE